MSKGIWFAIGAYLTWGVFPVYWKWLHSVPSLQLLAHRIGWSFVLLLGVLLVGRKWGEFRAVAFPWRVLRIYILAAVLIGINWLTYIWGVNNNYIIETSLGYFINPLLSVLMGVFFLRERLRPLQWLPIVLAAVGVTYLTISYGRLPWIALTLAFSFAIYGLVKKTAPLGALYGLSLETGLLFLPAVGWLLFSEFSGQGAFLHTSLTVDLLLIGAGVVTTVPLLLFASAAQRIPLSMIGVLQYIAPTMQFLLGLLVYKEPFDQARLIGFGIVWVALLIFWLEGALAARRRRLHAALVQAAGKKSQAGTDA
jgi:chloramphenicol-sensitive protein RarD